MHGEVEQMLSDYHQAMHLLSLKFLHWDEALGKLEKEKGIVA